MWNILQLMFSSFFYSFSYKVLSTFSLFWPHHAYLVCSYLRSGKISNWWQLCTLRSPAGSLRRLLVCSNAAVLSAAVLRKKERKYVDYYHSKSSFTFEMLKILNDRGSSVD